MNAIRPMNLTEAQEVMRFLVDEKLADEREEDLKDMNCPEYFSEYSYVIDNYMTGGPGYCGKVYIILWDGSPAAITTLYRMHDGKLAIGVMSDVDGNAGDGEAARF